MEECNASRIYWSPEEIGAGCGAVADAWETDVVGSAARDTLVVEVTGGARFVFDLTKEEDRPESIPSVRAFGTRFWGRVCVRVGEIGPRRRWVLGWMFCNLKSAFAPKSLPTYIPPSSAKVKWAW